MENDMYERMSLETALRNARIIGLSDRCAAALAAIRAAASAFSITDTGLVAPLWDRYTRLWKSRPSLASKGTFGRGRFLFVILLLFSPETINGKNLRRGVRRELASVFGMSGGSAVSFQVRQAISDYRNYGEFREDVRFVWNDFQRYLRHADKPGLRQKKIA